MEEFISTMTSESQKKRILGYIEKHGSITSWEATHNLDIMSPRKRLSEINRTRPLNKTVEMNIGIDERGHKKTVEKKFADVRSKMLKTTIEKGINPANAKVQSADSDGFYISDGRVTLHARYILAWGEVKAPHFRFIITDRKS